jgi:hypothetical protein
MLFSVIPLDNLVLFKSIYLPLIHYHILICPKEECPRTRTSDETATPPTISSSVSKSCINLDKCLADRTFPLHNIRSTYYSTKLSFCSILSLKRTLSFSPFFVIDTKSVVFLSYDYKTNSSSLI